jgi:hypothetical protein
MDDDAEIDLSMLLYKHDMNQIIELHREQIRLEKWLLSNDGPRWVNKEKSKERIRLLLISLYRNVNGCDPPDKLEDGWEDRL